MHEPTFIALDALVIAVYIILPLHANKPSI